MKIIFDGKEYAITPEDNILAREIVNLCPLKLSMSRSGEHEYYGTLNKKPDVGLARQTSIVRAGGVYFFAAWSAFSLVFRDADIHPYSVYVVGQAEDNLAEALVKAGRSVSIILES